MGDALPSFDFGAGAKAITIDAGKSHICALLNGGSIKYWGVNDVGQLGLGDTKTRGGKPGEMGDALPVVQLAGPAAAVSSGGNHSCALLRTATCSAGA